MAEIVSLTLARLEAERAARHAYASRVRLWRSMDALAVAGRYRPPAAILEARAPYWLKS